MKSNYLNYKKSKNRFLTVERKTNNRTCKLMITKNELEEHHTSEGHLIYIEEIYDSSKKKCELCGKKLKFQDWAKRLTFVGHKNRKRKLDSTQN